MNRTSPVMAENHEGKEELKRDGRLSLPKMLSGANAFEISDIERMNIGAHQPGI